MLVTYDPSPCSTPTTAAASKVRYDVLSDVSMHVSNYHTCQNIDDRRLAHSIWFEHDEKMKTPTQPDHVNNDWTTRSVSRETTV